MRGRRAIARWQIGERQLEAEHYLTGNQQFADTTMTIERGDDDRRNDCEQPGDEAAKPTGGRFSSRKPSMTTRPASVAAVTAEFWPAPGSARAKTGNRDTDQRRNQAIRILDLGSGGVPARVECAAVTIRIAGFANGAIIGAIAESKAADRMASPLLRVVRGASRVCTIDE